MTAEEEQKQLVINGLVGSVHKTFLETLRRRFEVAYADTFLEVRHSKLVVDEQRLTKLRQDRHFRMEWELGEAAKAVGIPCTARQLPENDYSFVYASAGAVGMTQSYVPYIGAKPQPAKFRDELAKAGRIPRLDLGDEPAETFRLKDFYALIAHNPIGPQFTEDQQKLGSIQLCVPDGESKSWALEIGLLELLGHYPVETKRRVSHRAPKWKTGADKKKGGDKG